MKKWLNSDYTIKRKNWTILFETIIETFIITLAVYICVTKYNETFVTTLNAIRDNDMALTFVEILFPGVLIIILLIKLGNCLISHKEVKKKRKK